MCRFHERFERSAEQVRIDSGFGPGAGVFAGGEAEAGEGVEYEWSEEFVADGWASGAPFDGGAGEESAVEKRDFAEGARGCGAASFRSVERAERQWSEELLPEVSVRVEDRFGVAGEEGAIVVEPALCFEELEEEQSGDVDECECASIVGVDVVGPGCCDVGDVCFEGAEEAASDGMSAEHVMPAEAGYGGVGVPCSGERGDRLSVGVEDVVRRGGKDGEAWSAGCAEPGGDGDRAIVGAVDADEPASGVGESIEVCGDFAECVAPVCGVGVFDEEECGRVVAGDASDSQVGWWVGESEGGEWSW